MKTWGYSRHLGRAWRTGVRSHEWWVGIRWNLPALAWEFNLLGLTLMIGKYTGISRHKSGKTRPDR